MASKDTYRSNNGKYLFDFVFEKRNGYYDVHIAQQPSYGIRKKDLHSTHRLLSDFPECRYRICFANPQDVPTLEKARKYAEAWAEATVNYIDRGERF